MQGSFMGLNESVVCLANVIGPLYVWFIFQFNVAIGLLFAGSITLFLVFPLSKVRLPSEMSKKNQ